MRKELYSMLCERLKTVNDGAIKHIDLWNHNVEFLEQEQGWERPAVFVEFLPIRWERFTRDIWRAEPTVRLHIVTDWAGSSSDGSEFQEDALKVFDLSRAIHSVVCDMTDCETFQDFDIVEMTTNHNHEDIVEHIDTYTCRATMQL